MFIVNKKGQLFYFWMPDWLASSEFSIKIMIFLASSIEKRNAPNRPLKLKIFTVFYAITRFIQLKDQISMH